MMVQEEGENVTKHLRSDICTAPAKSNYCDLQKSCEDLGDYI
jgi:hypothetical protein